MIKTLHGIVHGKIIELDEDLGVADGQDVEVQVKILRHSADPMSEGLARVYGFLGERDQSDYTDTSARHNGHQP